MPGGWRPGRGASAALLVLAAALAVAVGACRGRVPPDPDTIIVHDRDVARFWRALDEALASYGHAMTADAPPPAEATWDRGLEWELARVLQSRYLDSASTALQRFAGHRAVTATGLARAVRDRWYRYRAARRVTPTLAGPGFRERARLVQRRLQRWYPDAVFPEVHLVVGAAGSGGTVHRGGIVLAVEAGAHPEDHLQLWAHELAHAQQPRVGMNRVLNRALLEGGADLAAAWLTGRPVRSRSYAWGVAHEDEVRDAFARDAFTRRLGPWFGNEARPRWPADLGYFAGARILETGVAASAGFPRDTAAALRAVLRWTDADAVLAGSRWTVGPVARILAASRRRMGAAGIPPDETGGPGFVTLPPTDLRILAEATVTRPGGAPFHARVESLPHGSVRLWQSRGPDSPTLEAVLPGGPADTAAWNRLRGHELHALLLFPETRLYDPVPVPAGQDTLALRWMLNDRDSLVVRYAARDTLPLGVELSWTEPVTTVSLEGWAGVPFFRRAVFRQGGETATWTYTRVLLEPAEPSPYSSRRDAMGSTRDARRAGSQVARRLTATSTAGAAAKATGSR